MISLKLVLALIVLIWVFFGFAGVNICNRVKDLPLHILSNADPNDNFWSGLFADKAIG